MAASSVNISKDKVCDMCGNWGFPKDLVTCHLCKKTSEHIYCMEKLRKVVPKIWHCKECAPAKQVISALGQTTRVKRPSIFLETLPLEQSIAPVNGRRDYSKACKKSMVSRSLSPRISNTKVPRVSAAGPSGTYAVCNLSSRMDEQAASSPTKDNGKFYGPRLGASAVSPNKEYMRPAQTTMPIGQGTAIASYSRIHETEKFYCNRSPRMVNSGNSTLKQSAFSLPVDNEKSSGASLAALSGSRNREYARPAQRTTVAIADIEHNPLKLTEGIGFSYKGKTTQNDKASEADHMAFVRKKHVEECSTANCLPLNDIKPNAKALHANIFDPQTEINKSTEGILIGHIPSMGHGEPITADLSPNGDSGNTLDVDAQFNKSERQNSRIQSPMLVVSNGKHPHQPVPDAKWKGVFEIFDAVSHVCHGILGMQALIPGIISLKVYEKLKNWPETIKFKLYRREDIWPKDFRISLPTVGDIGLFFFPLEEKRSRETYMRFVEIMNEHDLAMQGWIRDMEVLIFTSAKLPQDSVTELGRGGFMWGVLRHLIQKKKNSWNAEKLILSRCTTSTSSPHGTTQDRTLKGESGANLAEIPHFPPGFSHLLAKRLSAGSSPVSCVLKES